jgi:uncharacterized protein DUF4349
MLRKSVTLICLSVLTSAGCARKAAHIERALSEPALKTVSMAMLEPTASAAQRYIAVRHKLVIVTAGSDLPKSLESMIDFCGTIQCEIISSNVTNQTRESAPSGSLFLRVTPGDLGKLLAFVEKQGKVAQHSTETEDKTAIVVDTEAKLKNLTEFRDNLRKMLAKPALTVRDLVEIQEKLTEVQSQLDAEARQRKILANETEKVAVEISLSAERAMDSAGMFAPVWDALRESGSVLAESLGALITSVAAIIPWLIVIVPGCWVLVRLWRRFRQSRIGKMARGTE